MFTKAPGLVYFANTEMFLDMSTYCDIIEKFISVYLPENASEEVRKDVERAREAIGTEIAFSSATGYLRSWRGFVSYCARKEMDFLPAKVDTVVTYFGYLARCNS